MNALLCYAIMIMTPSNDRSTANYSSTANYIRHDHRTHIVGVGVLNLINVALLLALYPTLGNN